MIPRTHQCTVCQRYYHVVGAEPLSILARGVCSFCAMGADYASRQGGPKSAASVPMGKVSESPYQSDLLPMRALLAVSKTLAVGEKLHPSASGCPDWYNTPTSVLLGRALTHILQYLSGDRSEQHLANASTRLLMALELQEIDNAAAIDRKSNAKALEQHSVQTEAQKT